MNSMSRRIFVAALPLMAVELASAAPEGPRVLTAGVNGAGWNFGSLGGFAAKGYVAK